jgi:hypothetical protein
MKKVLTAIICSLVLALSYTPVYAVEIANPITITNIGDLISKVSGITTPLAVVGFIFMVIYAGFVRMTAAGNAEKEAKGMKIAVSAMVGFAIIALAPLIVRILASFLGVQEEIVS